MNILDWDQVKTDLQKTLQKEGPESIPVTTFSLWRLVRDTLLNTDAKVKEQMFETERTFRVAQDDASKKSLKALESESESESFEDEEEILEKEIEELRFKLKKCKEKSVSTSRPPSRNSFFKRGGFCSSCI